MNVSLGHGEKPIDSALLTFFLRASLRRGSAARSAVLRSQASKPRACARRSFSSLAPRSRAARRLAPLYSARKPRNPAPALAAHFLPSRLAPARLGGSLRCTPLASLETPRL